MQEAEYICGRAGTNTILLLLLPFSFPDVKWRRTKPLFSFPGPSNHQSRQPRNPTPKNREGAISAAGIQDTHTPSPQNQVPRNQEKRILAELFVYCTVCSSGGTSTPRPPPPHSTLGNGVGGAAKKEYLMKNSCTSPPFPRHYLSPPLLLRTSSLHPSPPRFCCYAILPGSRCYFKQFPLFLLGSTGRYNKPFLRPNAANYAFRSNRMLTFPCMQVGRAKIPRAGPSVLRTRKNEDISIHPSPLFPQFRRCFHYVSTRHP